ncbi:MAG TPA: hypothetical protein PLJ12_03570 [Planctomycetota bacterium]|nr:hypothetical protein [Planctomycetota bacterium]
MVKRVRKGWGLWWVLAVAWGGGGSLVWAVPQSPSAAQAEPFDFQKLLERDRGVSFPPRAGATAVESLQSEGLTPSMRAAALFTLGETQTSSARSLVEPWLKRGSVQERCAAVLAWGQMGTFLDGEDPFLVDLLGDSQRPVAEAALFALYMHTPALVLDRLAFLVARPDEPLFQAAEHILEWHERGTCSRPGPVSYRLELRWQAARAFGTVDGLLWSAHLVDRLAEDPEYLDAVLLPAVGDLLDPRVKDYVAELLLREPAAEGPPLAAILCMPAELDRMIESGYWLPATLEQQTKMLDLAEKRGLSRFLPNFLARTAMQPSLTLRAAGWLSSIDSRYQDVIEENMRSPEPRLRSLGAKAAGQAALPEWVVRLRDLSRDPDPGVRVEAMVARLQSGDDKAEGPIRGYFFEDRAETPDAVRYLALTLMLEARSARVLDLVASMHRDMAPGFEKASMAAILLQGGRPVATDSIRGYLQAGISGEFWHLRMIEALGYSALDADRRFLEDAFPQQGDQSINVALAKSLLQLRSEDVLPIIKYAIWNGDMNRSFLAGALLAQRYGDLRLMQWVERPPEGATTEDLRRVGFIIGSLGGIEAVEILARHLNAVVGADRPELQGAMLGVLSSRTY